MRNWLGNGLAAVTIAALAAGGGFYAGRKVGSGSQATPTNPGAQPGTAHETLGSVNSKPVTKTELSGGELYKIYEAETQVFNAYSRILEERWLNSYFDNFAAEKKVANRAAAQESFIRENVMIDDARVAQIVEQFKNDDRLKALNPEQQKDEVRRALQAQEGQKAIRQLVVNARATGALSLSIPEPVEPSVEVTDGGNPFLGPKDAKVTIIEFADYQCPFCARMVPTLNEVVKKYEGKVRWVYRDWPLNFHPNAIPAALAANCAGAQGKYFEAHNILFENHEKLGEDVYTKMAETLQLDKAKFEACRKDEAQKKEIMADFEAGEKIGVNGTPAYFVNGRRLKPGADVPIFSKIIEEELAK